ncbi:MAG TPA: bacillithiol transferase BstA [Blastocatellia bacterium]|nr:bacillithiol transferase BstA [Blastocatellia bacterium]
MTTDLRYPIGKFDLTTELTSDQRQECIRQIAEAPAKLRAAIAGLTPDQLETPYRPDGWTVCQVVHHVPDSHMNSYIRFKLAITEDEPTIRPYYEDRWAELIDARRAPIEVSLALLESLHTRWVMLLESMTESDFARKLTHPELGTVNLNRYAGLYAWHGRHHVAHITSLRERMGWS